MLKKQVHGNHISKSKKRMAKITDFFLLLALQAWANAITHFLCFRIMGRNMILNITNRVYKISQQLIIILSCMGQMLTTYSRCCHDYFGHELESRPQMRQKVSNVRK